MSDRSLRTKIRALRETMRTRLCEDYSVAQINYLDNFYARVERLHSELADAVIQAEANADPHVIPPDAVKNFRTAADRLRQAQPFVQQALMALMPDTGSWGPWHDTDIT